MKVLVTADLHLKESEPERLEVWDWILDVVEERSVDLLLVAGDLFNSDQDGSALSGEVQADIRDRLPEGVRVVMVAGNHDSNLAQLGWPPGVTILEHGESEQFTDESVSLTLHGLPYREGKVFPEIEDEANEGFHWVVGHGSYLSPSHRHIVESIEKQDGENECFLYERDLEKTEFDRVILGHWHGQAELGSQPPVHYPGSPVPNSLREEGPKALLEFELDDHSTTVESIPVETPPGWYYRREELLVLPGFESEVLDRFEEILAAGESGCRLQVSLRGFLQVDVSRFRDQLAELCDEYREEWANLELDDTDLQESGEFDEPFVQRALEALRQVEPGDEISIEEYFDGDHRYVRETARELLSREPGTVRRRAEELLMRAIYEVGDQA